MRSSWKLAVGLLVLLPCIGSGAARAECEDPTPIEVVSSSLSGNKLEAGLNNPTSSELSAYLYGTVQAGGRLFHFYGLVTVAPQSTEQFEIVLPGTITLLERLDTCGGIPWGVSDTSDPIVVVPKKKDQEDP